MKHETSAKLSKTLREQNHGEHPKQPHVAEKLETFRGVSYLGKASPYRESSPPADHGHTIRFTYLTERGGTRTSSKTCHVSVSLRRTCVLPLRPPSRDPTTLLRIPATLYEYYPHRKQRIYAVQSTCTALTFWSRNLSYCLMHG